MVCAALSPDTVAVCQLRSRNDGGDGQQCVGVACDRGSDSTQPRGEGRLTAAAYDDDSGCHCECPSEVFDGYEKKKTAKTMGRVK